MSHFDGEISQSTDIIEAPTRIDDYSDKFTNEEKISETVKDQFDGFYDFNQPDTETSAEPETKSSDTESIIAKAIENENEITKVLEKSKKNRNLNRQNSINQVLQKNEQNHDSDGGSPRKSRIITRQNSFKSVKKFFQVNLYYITHTLFQINLNILYTFRMEERNALEFFRIFLEFCCLLLLMQNSE